MRLCSAPNGSCVCLPLSTIFLMGPVKQLKRMFEPTRLIATILVLVRTGGLGGGSLSSLSLFNPGD